MANMEAPVQQPVFRDLTDVAPEPEVTEIDSLCMDCGENGITRLMLTRIPFYKNVVIMSFACDKCGYQNNEIQPGGAFSETGVRWKLSVEQPVDLNRRVVKSDYTSLKIPELDFEVPAQSQKGEVTTVEGVVQRAITALSQDQEARRIAHPEEAKRIDEFITRLQDLTRLTTPWTLEMEDITGNCHLENPDAPHKDPRAEKTTFKRTKEQDHLLGIFTKEELSEGTEEPVSTEEAASSLLSPADPSELDYDQMERDEVLTFPTNCPDCNAPVQTNMKITKIPYFKEVVIMATSCDLCGHRSNEVKSGGGVEPKGVRFEFRVAEPKDLVRDVLKAETCSMEIPELKMEVGGHALGGRFTTAEGLLRATVDQLLASENPFGDAPSEAAKGVKEFVDRINRVIELQEPVTIVLDDPAGNSYVQSLADDPALPDDGLKVTHYERSWEQNDELGLNDMNVENYEQETNR